MHKVFFNFCSCIVCIYWLYRQDAFCSYLYKDKQTEKSISKQDNSAVPIARVLYLFFFSCSLLSRQYPHLVSGAVASSAPVEAKTDFQGYNNVG